MDCFYHWLKLKLEDEVIIGLAGPYQEITKLIFNQMEGRDENLESATDCMVELIYISRRKEEFE
jgi:hypothetical protein